MKITAIAPWFGSKRTLASRIVEVIGNHKAYFEPFCGSCAVLLAKKPCTMETVNDLHGDLVNMSRCLRDESLAVQLYAKLSRTLMHEGIFREEAAAWKEAKHQPAGDVPDFDRAYRFFLCSWMGMNGVAGTQSYNQGFCARFTKNGGHAGTRFCNAVDSIPDWHRRLRSVTILSRCGIELAEKIEDAEGIAIFVDPPYLVKGSKYVHDFKAEDHLRLSNALRRFKNSRVVVSYYDHPLLAELYPDWQKIHCDVAKSMISSGKRNDVNATRAPEVLLVNQSATLFGD